jgi:hypothetical protein
VKQYLSAQHRHALYAVILAAAAAVLAAGGVAAQSPADKYPDKPIKIIVPFAPGDRPTFSRACSGRR